MRRWVVIAAALLLGACAFTTTTSVSELTVDDPRIGAPAGENAALYLTVRSSIEDRLIEARTDVAVRVELHETVHGDDGTMGMRQVEAFTVSPGQDLILEPGGAHIMLLDVEELTVGEIVPVTLVFEEAGEIEVPAEVVDLADTMGEDHADH